MKCALRLQEWVRRSQSAGVDGRVVSSLSPRGQKHVMMRNLRRLVAGAGVGLGLLPALAGAQQPGTPTIITGRVTSAGGGPLQAASVSIPAVGVGAYTQADGRYTFTVPATRAVGQAVTLQARRIGFEPKSLQITLSGG